MLSVYFRRYSSSWLLFSMLESFSHKRHDQVKLTSSYSLISNIQTKQWINFSSNYAGLQRGCSTHLLSPKAFQFLFQPCAQPQFQRLPLLACRLQLSQRALQPLHFLHVGLFPLKLFLQLPVASLRWHQGLLEPLTFTLTLLPRDAQVLNLLFQVFTFLLLLLI